MSERGAEVRARLATMNELEEVLGAMRGMAAARIQQGERAQAAAREYADRIGAAFSSLTGEARSVLPPDPPGREPESLVIALCTERGFVGALNERTLRSATETPGPYQLCIVGARGQALAREQGLTATSVGSMPSHLGGIGDAADQIGALVLEQSRSIDDLSVEIVHPRRTATGGIAIERRRLLPLDLTGSGRPGALPPITMLPAPLLMAQIAGEYVHARLFEFVAESFAAANSASLEVLQAAHTHLDDMLVDLRRSENVLRQDEITAEVLEVITGRMQGAP